MGKMMVEPPWACLVLGYPRNVNTEGDHRQGLAVPVSHEYNTDGKWEECPINIMSAGSASSDNNIEQTTNTEILNTIDMMTHGELTALTAQLFTEL